jgi:hypothetical protein
MKKKTPVVTYSLGWEEKPIVATISEYKDYVVWAGGRFYFPSDPDFQKAVDGKFSWNKDENEES